MDEKEYNQNERARDPGDLKIDSVTALITLVILNAGSVIAYFLILFVTNPFTNEMVRLGTVSKENMELIRSGVCVLIYFILMLIIAYNNPVEKTRFINSEAGRGTNYLKEFVGYAKRCGVIHPIAIALFALPVHIAVAIWPDIKYLPTVFLPQYSFIPLTGNVWISYAENIVFYTVVTLLFTPLCHVIWDRKRLHK